MNDNFCEIHPSASIHPGVSIGKGAKILAGAVIYEDTVIGEGTIVGENSVLGKTPGLSASSTVKNEDALPPLSIGAKCIIGTNAVICRGSAIGNGCVAADFSLIRENVTIGYNSVVGAHAVVENKVTIGNNVKIQTRAYITALTVIEDFVFIAPCVVTTNDNFMGRTEDRFKYKGGAKIRRGARVGAGVVVLPNVEIGPEAFVAAGSVVTRNVDGGILVMGSPAKPVRNVDYRERLDANSEKS